MSSDVIDRPPHRVAPSPARKQNPKIEPPQKWQVVLDNPDKCRSSCVPCVLTDVFRKSVDEANGLWIISWFSGRSLIEETSKDIAQTRATEANKKLTSGVCIPAPVSIRFKAQ